MPRIPTRRRRPLVQIDLHSDERTDFMRERLVDEIRDLNPTASAEYLAGFDNRSLRLYLAHLHASAEPRGRGAVWQRPGDTPVIVTAEPAD
ncbi:MAG: hypothetical protein VYC34_08890 [Planctomycetota bacterium]|nr:hypothetical protein [Planctomycetota bacterium]